MTEPERTLVASSDRGDAHETVVPVIEEHLSVRKETIDTGAGVRLRKVIDQETASVNETLSSHTVDVKRFAMEQYIDAPLAIRYEDETTIVPVVVERLLIRKQLVLVEEIHIRRSTTSEPFTQTVALRRERIIVERQDPQTGEWRTVDEHAAQ